MNSETFPFQAIEPFIKKKKMMSGTLEEKSIKGVVKSSKTQISMMYSTTICAFENISFERT